ncbi:MAG: 50S ribosomal protein L6 [Candidatus Daviesbacteria bacterium]|nr:50S ribosomal protein L6 [Candidatus Daviesbacteria bacterium]
MSRIGNAPIQIPSGVTVNTEGQSVIVNGPLGQLKITIDPKIKVEVENQEVKLKRKDEGRVARSLHGLSRALIANMVIGVEKGWQKKLELVGVGFRASGGGEKLILNVGYSHPIEVIAPEGIKFNVEENTKITVSGIDKSLVGQVSAKVRSVRKPEPYKGKGIRYSGEYIKKKAGKAGKVGTGAK